MTFIKYLFYINFFFLIPHIVTAQQEPQTMTLEEVLEWAQTKSLSALRISNQFLAGYWQYRSFKASLLPYVTLNVIPAEYNRSWTQRYDNENNVDVFRQQQTYFASGILSISQNIGFSGGTLSLSSSLGRLENLNNSEFSFYNVNPVQLSYQQSLFGFNSFKWDEKLEPLLYDISRQQYLQNLQQINLEVITRYFDLILAYTQREIAARNIGTSDTLYQIGQKRFEIAAIPQEELLNLELNKFKANIELAQAEKQVKKAQFNLNSFLGMDKNYVIEPVLPDMSFDKPIPLEQAIAYALEHNPEMLGLKEKIMSAARDLDQIKKESHFNASLFASFGLNNSATTLSGSYTGLENSQRVSVGMEIPIADWGQRKGQRLMAERQKEVVDIEVQQEQLDTEQEVALKVIDFNLQPKLLESALKAAEIAEKAYTLTKKRFVLGKADVLKLNSASQAMQEAREAYINELYNLWRLYYEVQQLTLYDFKNDQPLSADFDKMISQ